MTVSESQLNEWIDLLKRGELTEQHIQAARGRPQDLLYLQAGNTSVNSPVQGMGMVTNGEWSDGPADPSAWPYRTVLEAIRDGWRVIQFPNLALLLDESRTYGLGCEFILER